MVIWMLKAWGVGGRNDLFIGTTSKEPIFGLASVFSEGYSQAIQPLLHPEMCYGKWQGGKYPRKLTSNLDSSSLLEMILHLQCGEKY